MQELNSYKMALVLCLNVKVKEQVWRQDVLRSLRFVGAVDSYWDSWVSAFLILLGVIHVTLGGIGQDGFNTIREFYFLSSSTFDGFSRILIGILLLNLTVRGKKYTKRLLTFGNWSMCG